LIPGLLIATFRDSTKNNGGGGGWSGVNGGGGGGGGGSRRLVGSAPVAYNLAAKGEKPGLRCLAASLPPDTDSFRGPKFDCKTGKTRVM